MPRDAHGLSVTAASEEAARAYDLVIDGYLGYRADTAQRLAALLAVDGEFALGHALRGCLTMLAYNAGQVPAARAALEDAKRYGRQGTAREQAHVSALEHWTEGDVEGALGVWEQILEEHPRDVLAFRLHHFNAFWRGMPERMLSVVETVLPHWTVDLPEYGAVLACRSFANEECGNYVVAETAGRAAIAIDAGNLWAAHAVAHVLEMQGRRSEGIAFLNGLEPNWDGGNNLKHHLWWHRALFHLERREFEIVLDLYDRCFRDAASPLTAAAPDLYIDVQNAASMLMRLELRGIDVGGRWAELADKAEARIGDCLSLFTLPHWMMALAGAGRWEQAERMLEAVRDAARTNSGATARLIRDAALPACEAVLAHRRTDYPGAVSAMRPALGNLYRMGGSHAQQDVLEQLFLDAALKAGSEPDARLLLERVAARYPVPLERRVGYAEAARRIAH